MDQKKSNYRFVILFLICLSAISSCYCQYQLSPMGNQLRATYNLTSVQFASICTAPMIPAIFFSLIVGVIVDKIGAKKVIITGLVLAAIGLVLRIFASNYLSLYICMILPGFAASFLNATNPKIFGQWFSAKRVGIMVGLFQAANALGQAVAIGTTAMLPSYKTAFYISAILAVVTLILWFFFMKEGSTQKSEENKSKTSTKECLKRVLTSKGVLVAGFSILCVYGAYTVITTYMTMALESRGISSVVAGATTSIVSVAKLIGCIIVPILISKVKDLKPVVFVLAIIIAGMTIIAWRLPVGILLTSALFIIGLCIGGLVPVLVSLPIQLPEIGPQYAGTAGGVVATLQLLGAVAVPTYICAPIAGDNYFTMFLLAGGIAALVCLLSLFFPKLSQEKNS